jgi:hypothetical protein
MQLLRLLKLPVLNLILFRLFPAEAVMVLLYLVTWFVPGAMIRLDGGIVEGLTWGMFMQFIFGHSAVGIALARHFTTTQIFRVLAVSAAGLIYALFIAGFAYATKSYLLLPLFFISVVSAFREPEGGESALMQGVLYPFFSVMLLLLSSLSLLLPVPKFGFSEALPIDYSMFEVRGEPNHPESIMFWGIAYYTLLTLLRKFWESRVIGKKGNSE